MEHNRKRSAFPTDRDHPRLDNLHAYAFQELSRGREQDTSWALLDGLPNGATLMEQGVIAVLNGEMTPQQAADHLQNGLAVWFEPAQTCGGAD